MHNNIKGKIIQTFEYKPDIFSSDATLDIDNNIIKVHAPNNFLSEEKQPYNAGSTTYYFLFSFDNKDYKLSLVPTSEETFYWVDIEDSPGYSNFLLYRELQDLPITANEKSKSKI